METDGARLNNDEDMTEDPKILRLGKLAETPSGKYKAIHKRYGYKASQ